MKNTIIVGLWVYTFAILNTGTLNGQVGCLDDSSYLGEKFDTKELHYVTCNCECKHILQPRNKCLFCMHYHAGPAWEIINTQPTIKEPYFAPKMVLNPAQRNVKKILNTLANRMHLVGS